jgi:hypothetical protein
MRDLPPAGSNLQIPAAAERRGVRVKGDFSGGGRSILWGMHGYARPRPNDTTARARQTVAALTRHVLAVHSSVNPEPSCRACRELSAAKEIQCAQQ